MIKMEKNICTVKNRNELRLDGDLLFCPKHRADWRALIRFNGFSETILTPKSEKAALEQFREGGINDNFI